MHLNLYETDSNNGDVYRAKEARNFFQTLLNVAPDFPEFDLCLLNYNDAPKASIELSVDVYESSFRSEAIVFSPVAQCSRTDVWSDETADTIRLWLQGVSLAQGLRCTASQADLIVRLAYELADPEDWSFEETRWGIAKFRMEAHRAAAVELERLIDEWSMRSPWQAAIST